LGRLPCGGDGLGFGEFRDDAELLHKAQSIPIDKAFGHFAVRKAGNAYACDIELLPCPYGYPGKTYAVEFRFPS